METLKNQNTMSVSNSNERVRELYALSYYLRKQSVTMVYRAKTGHAAPALSMAELITVLYFEKLNIDPDNPKWGERDRFVLSKGHACPLYYAALAKRGFFSEKMLETYRALDSKLQGHPDMRKVPGCDMTTGSLGNGIAAALGMALIGKRENKEYFVYAIAGDGEIQEGISWEAFMAAAHYHLDNYILLIDRNGLQSGGNTEDIISEESLEAKFVAFNWDVQTIDGHDIKQIDRAIDKAKIRNRRPHAIIAKTIKGKGVSYMEGQYLWHMKAPDDAQFAIAMHELDEEIAKYE